MEDKIIIRRVDRLTGEQWQVVQFKVAGLAKGETVLATLCGGNMGKVLAATVAKQAASMAMIDVVEMEAEPANATKVAQTNGKGYREVRDIARRYADALGLRGERHSACLNGFIDAAKGLDATPPTQIVSATRTAYLRGYNKATETGASITKED